jgi:glutamate racemase
MKDSPIGVFDSGIGGLTVVKEIIATLPDENLIYLGDTARVPYGNRDREVIAKFALELTRFLLGKKVKALVVACNTISATCLSEIEKLSPVPVIGVIKPTVTKAVEMTRTGKIGVIGTRATINSQVYEREIHAKNGELQVIQQACPLFVPLAEEGFVDHPAAKLIAQEYLSRFKNSGIDTLILGCTHYPLLKELIRSVLDDGIKLVDSAEPTAEELKKVLEVGDLIKTSLEAKRVFCVTDAPERVLQTANIFFENKFPGKLEKVSLEVG